MEEIVVMKFGGTSVATPENRAQAIAHVKQELAAGKAPVVVVSAMGRMGAPCSHSFRAMPGRTRAI